MSKSYTLQKKVWPLRAPSTGAVTSELLEHPASWECICLPEALDCPKQSVLMMWSMVGALGYEASVWPLERPLWLRSATQWSATPTWLIPNKTLDTRASVSFPGWQHPLSAVTSHTVFGKIRCCPHNCTGREPKARAGVACTPPCVPLSTECDLHPFSEISCNH